MFLCHQGGPSSPNIRQPVLHRALKIAVPRLRIGKSSTVLRPRVSEPPLAWALASPHVAPSLASCCLPASLRWPLPALDTAWRQTVVLWDPSHSLGWILIDRCGKHFGTILNYLRDDTITLPQSRQEIQELMAEAKYYLIQGLVSTCQTALQVWEVSRGLVGSRVVPLGTRGLVDPWEAGLEMRLRSPNAVRTMGSCPGPAHGF